MLCFFQKICFSLQYFDHLRVSELTIVSVEGLHLVSDKELFIGTVNGTENVGFAKRLTTVLLDSWTRGPEAGVSSLIRSHSYFSEVSLKDKRNLPETFLKCRSALRL